MIQHLDENVVTNRNQDAALPPTVSRSGPVTAAPSNAGVALA